MNNTETDTNNLALSPITVPKLLAKKGKEKIAALTAYDYTFARLLDATGIDFILVGDSLSSVIQGHPSTIPVTLDEMIYHCKCVSRGVEQALVVGDLPFMTYQISPEQALQSAGRLIKEGGVSAVKLEGGILMEKTIERIVNIDIPVMGHVGLTPQSYHRMGGHRIQGKKSGNIVGSKERVLEDAKAVERAGAFAIVLEGIPSKLAKEITDTISIPTIGIGAGLDCDGQILVTHDMLGLNSDKVPSFVTEYLNLNKDISKSINSYMKDTKKEEKLKIKAA